MTEPNPTAAERTTEAAAPEPDPTTAENTENEDDLSIPQNIEAARKLRAENKSLRERLRESEESSGLAATQLAAMRRAEVERIAAEHLIDPTDMWASNPEVGGFLTDEGTIDTQRVSEAAQAITAAKPHLAAPQRAAPPPSNRPVESLRSGAMPDTVKSAPTWSTAIRVRAK